MMQRLFLFGTFLACNVLQAGEANLMNFSSSSATNIDFSTIENALNTTSTTLPALSFVNIDCCVTLGLIVCVGGIYCGCRYKEKCKNCIRPSEQDTH